MSGSVRRFNAMSCGDGTSHLGRSSISWVGSGQNEVQGSILRASLVVVRVPWTVPVLVTPPPGRAMVVTFHEPLAIVSLDQDPDLDHLTGGSDRHKCNTIASRPTSTRSTSGHCSRRRTCSCCIPCPLS